MLNKRYEQIELTNMCMIYDNEGNVVVHRIRLENLGVE